MALNENVKTSLSEAEGNLRNALYWASKNERSSVCVNISKLISQIESIVAIDKFSDNIENNIKNSNGEWFKGLF
jgi:hypothetical protein